MTEEAYYSEENFNLSYESRQKEMRRILIRFRCGRHWSCEELAEKCGIEADKINQMEIGNERISLLDFAKILDVCGIFDDWEWQKR